MHTTIRPSSITPDFDKEADDVLLTEIDPKAVFAFKLDQTAWTKNSHHTIELAECKVDVAYRVQISRVRGQNYHILFGHWLRTIMPKNSSSLQLLMGNCNCNQQTSVADRLYLASDLEQLMTVARTLLDAVSQTNPNVPGPVEQIAMQTAAILSAKAASETIPS
jgi:hypothetical protein